MDHITSLYNEFLVLSKENQLMGTAFSLWGLSVLTYVARNIPSKVFSFLIGQLTTSLTINNSGYEATNRAYVNFLKLAMSCKGGSSSRSLALSSAAWEDKTGVLGAGYGLHFFVNRMRLFWFYKNKVESNGGNMQKEEIIIYTYGRGHKPFVDLVSDITPRLDKSRVHIFTLNWYHTWDWIADVPVRSLKSVITCDNVRENIINAMKSFYDSKEWYDSKGFSYKQTHILYGPPGTGKTSLVKAIAGVFNKPIYSLSLDRVSSGRFQEVMTAIPSGAICLIEDFDTSNAVKTRTVEYIDREESHSPMSLGEVLNVLDGIVGLNDIVLFMTTNCLNNIDPALLRKGRIDHTHYVGPLNDSGVKEYVLNAFPDADVSNLNFSDMLGCDLSGLLLEYKQDKDKFIGSIPLKS